MDFHKINHSRLYEDVLMQLENYIKSNGLKPNDKLPAERVIAEQLGVSRGTLREAFRVLETNGVLTAVPGSGRTLRQDITKVNLIKELITDVEYSDAMHLMELRLALEKGILELAIQRATSQDLLEVEISHQLSERSSDLKNSFHLALAKATHNEAFYNALYLNLSQLASIRIYSNSKDVRDKIKREQHGLILDAVRERDLDLAIKRLEEHLSRVEDSLDVNDSFPHEDFPPVK